MEKAYDAHIESHESITIHLEVEYDDGNEDWDAQIRVSVGPHPSAEMPACVLYPFGTADEARAAGVEEITKIYEHLFEQGWRK